MKKTLICKILAMAIAGVATLSAPLPWPKAARTLSTGRLLAQSGL